MVAHLFLTCGGKDGIDTMAAHLIIESSWKSPDRGGKISLPEGMLKARVLPN